MALFVRPVDLKVANKLVEKLHRHHQPVVTHRFSLAAYFDSKLVGVAICARPASREVDQHRVLEVSRLVTDGTKNACSILYAACARAAKEMGFEAIQTYTLASEPGTSLKASGWVLDGVTKPKPWRKERRKKVFNTVLAVPKVRWVRLLNKWPVSFQMEVTPPRKNCFSKL
jgi:hypothetical protein